RLGLKVGAEVVIGTCETALSRSRQGQSRNWWQSQPRICPGISQLLQFFAKLAKTSLDFGVFDCSNRIVQPSQNLIRGATKKGTLAVDEIVDRVSMSLRSCIAVGTKSDPSTLSCCNLVSEVPLALSGRAELSVHDSSVLNDFKIADRIDRAEHSGLHFQNLR